MDCLSAKYEEVLSQVGRLNDKSYSLTTVVKNQKYELSVTQKSANESETEVDILAQCLRRHSAKITGLQLTEEVTCVDLVMTIGKDMGVDLEEDLLPTHYPLVTEMRTTSLLSGSLDGWLEKSATFGTQRISPALTSRRRSISLSSFNTALRKTLFGSVNKMKKELKLKYIWTNNGRVYLNQGENARRSFIFDSIQLIWTNSKENCNLLCYYELNLLQSLLSSSQP